MTRRTDNGSKTQDKLTALLDAELNGRDWDPKQFQVNRSGVKFSISDVSYSDERVVIYVDGCYWHECPEHHPDSRNGLVRKKDAVITAAIRETDWTLFRVWEHEDLERRAKEIVAVVRDRQKKLRQWRASHVAAHEARAWCHDCTHWDHEPWPVSSRECMRCEMPVADHLPVPVEFAQVLARVGECRERHIADDLAGLTSEGLVELQNRLAAEVTRRLTSK